MEKFKYTEITKENFSDFYTPADNVSVDVNIPKKTRELFKKLQNKTRDQVIGQLKYSNRSMMIRPTGFGKTHILTDLCKKEYADKTILYLYPSKIIANAVAAKITDEEEMDFDPETIDTINCMTKINNVTLLTYQKFCKLNEKELKELKYDYVICDECHRLGATLTAQAMHAHMRLHPETKYLGATATPVRSDGFDILATFFNNKKTDDYGLIDALNDGILKRPYYCKCTPNVIPAKELKQNVQETTEALKKSGMILDGNYASCDMLKRYKAEFAKQLIEWSDMHNMDHIIKETCDAYALDTNYMMFIVFFANHDHMHEKIDDVVNWYHKAYPEHKITVTFVSSLDKNEHDNADIVNSFPKEDKTIRIIACVDMLNLGYHINNLTGIMMYRVTKSNIIYTQQLGRVLSITTDNSAIIFDVVNNINTEAVYMQKPPTTRKVYKKVPEGMLTKLFVDFDDEKDVKLGKSRKKTTVYTVYEEDSKHHDVIETRFVMHKMNKKIFDQGTGEEAPFIYIPEYDHLVDPNPVEITRNQFPKEIFNMLGIEATEREFQRRITAHTVYHAIRRAIEMFIFSWCNEKGLDYPTTLCELTEKGLSADDWLTSLRQVLDKEGLEVKYALADTQTLMEINKQISLNKGCEDTDNNVLYLCAKSQSVSVEAILDILGLERKNAVRIYGLRTYRDFPKVTIDMMNTL